MKEEKLKKIRFVAVYCGSHIPVDSEYVDAVVEFGKYLANHNMTLVYGGSNTGLMKVLADSVLENGGTANGVFTASLSDSLRHPGLTDCIITRNLAERKAEMLRQADVVVALPGSFGTWDELFDALALRKNKNGHKLPIGILNIKGYFNQLLEFVELSIQLGFTTPGRRNLLKAGKTPEVLFKQLAGSMVAYNQDLLLELLSALRTHDIAKVKTLFDTGIDPNVCFEGPGFTSLRYARNSVATLKILCECGANVRKVGWHIWTQLEKADEKGMRFLIGQGLDVTWFKPDGTSPLSEACAGGFCVSTLRLLLEHGAAVSQKILNRAFICACSTGKDTKVLQFLLGLGADL